MQCTMKTLALLTIIFFVCVHCKIPDYIHVCQKNDPQVSACIVNSINALIPYLKSGIKELDVPPLEPLQLNAIQLKLGSNDAKMTTNITNISVWGASTFRINQLRADIPSHAFHYNVTIPKLHLDGKYQIDTKILFLNLRGNGPIKVDITDYMFNCVMRGHLINKANNKYLEFEKMNCKIQVADAKIYLENLFNGNQVLGNATNSAINENLNEFFNELRPNITESLNDIFITVANKITLQFTYDELFP